MADTQELSDVAAEFRRHFDQYYLGVIPRLLNERGLFLAFLSMLAAVESLAGTYMPGSKVPANGFGLSSQRSFQKFFKAGMDELLEVQKSRHPLVQSKYIQ